MLTPLPSLPDMMESWKSELRRKKERYGLAKTAPGPLSDLVASRLLQQKENGVWLIDKGLPTWQDSVSLQKQPLRIGRAVGIMIKLGARFGAGRNEGLID